MADSAVAITAGVGTNIDTRTESSNGDHRQVIVIGDPSTNAAVAPVSATNGLAVQLMTAIPAGSASIGVLGANSGVDIGDTTINNTTSNPVPVGGDAAHDAVDSGNPIKIGGRARTTPGAEVSNNDRVEAFFDTLGRMGTFGYNTPSTEYIAASGGGLLQVKKRPVNVGTNGQVLISGVFNKVIRVISGLLVSSAAVTINLKSNNNQDAGGPLPLAANQGFQIPYAPTGNFDTLPSQNLTISLNAAANVGGWLAYVEV